MPSCLSSVLFSHDERLRESSGDFIVRSAAGSGNTASGAVTVLAAADLGAGTLKAVVSATGIGMPSGLAQGANAFASSVVGLGDSFSAFNADGSRYTAGGLSTMSININGTLAGTLDSNLFVTAQIVLARPGYLDALSRGDSAAMSVLRIDWANTGWIYADGSLPAAPLTLSFATPSTSWEAYVSLWTGLNFRQAASGHIFGVADLSHTVTASLRTPVDTYFGSASVLFPNTGVVVSAIPEPATWWLLAGGLLATLLASRQRDAHISH